MTDRLSHASSVSLLTLLCTLAVTRVSAQSRGPTDWSDWQKYRDAVVHPATTIKASDLKRARENIERYDWARAYVDRLRKSADAIVEQTTPEYLERMVEVTTPGCVGPCPACRAKGLPWHPNGQWSWSPAKPDQLTCRVCKTVFPNEKFPEEIVLQSKWDPRQRFGFIGGETFKCFGYRYARPSISGIIRARKVGHVTGRLHALATAYALTEDARYARAAKAILLRFAEVLPTYLVRAGYGYGEYCDMDPHVAAERISDLPEDELVYPPNKPDRKLYAGYWAASRIGSSGMDGGWVVRVTEAYDLTCTARDEDGPVYSREERIRIERDVLLEGAYLAVCDPAINNKSVGNRAGAAIVGLCVGHPGLVHFGLDGFVRAVDGWFLPDGGTSESPAYAMMTMSGIRPFGLAFRDYSDPEGYVAADGSRLEHFNASRDTRYGDCWQGLIWTLQGNLKHPPSADSYRATGIRASDAELIAVAYPTDEHIALLKELAGEGLTPRAPREATFYREPGLDERQVASLRLPDVVFPFLAQGYARLGEDGRKGLLMLNASNWGGHHHMDSLNLYYWQDGRELLSDLGYLWDHPDSYQTRRTFAHNTVLIDGGDQRGRDRGGSFHIFSVTPRVKVMEASSKAYAQATDYRRTCVLVDHGDAGSYVLDIFRAAGGRARDYVFHGPSNDFTVDGLTPAPPSPEARAIRFAIRFHLAALGEVLVDDVEIRRVLPDGKEGPNLMPNPSASGEAEGTPSGWGLYVGNGKAEWGLGTPGRGDERCARLRATKADDEGRVNVALIAGDSNGYTGTRAILGEAGATYKLRFAIRGDAKGVAVGFVSWPSDPASPNDRRHGPVALDGASRAVAGADWTEYAGTFKLPTEEPPLTNVSQADGSRPWRITWNVDEEYQFAVWSPGGAGETVIIGDGWGQRDHRNTDRGATLPYIIRRCEEADAASAFVTAFAGQPKDRQLVRGVRRLRISGEAPADAIALSIDTPQGTDVIVSMIAPDTITVDGPAGDLVTDGRVAVVLTEADAPAAACLVGGTTLTTRAVELRSPAAAYSGEVVEAVSDGGESYFVVRGDLPGANALSGATIFVTGGDGIRRAYPIRRVRSVGDSTRVYTKVDDVGFEARPAETWEVLTTSVWESQ